MKRKLSLVSIVLFLGILMFSPLTINADKKTNQFELQTGGPYLTIGDNTDYTYPEGFLTVHRFFIKDQPDTALFCLNCEVPTGAGNIYVDSGEVVNMAVSWLLKNFNEKYPTAPSPDKQSKSFNNDYAATQIAIWNNTNPENSYVTDNAEVFKLNPEIDQLAKEAKEHLNDIKTTDYLKSLSLNLETKLDNNTQKEIDSGYRSKTKMTIESASTFDSSEMDVDVQFNKPHLFVVSDNKKEDITDKEGVKIALNQEESEVDIHLSQEYYDSLPRKAELMLSIDANIAADNNLATYFDTSKGETVDQRLGVFHKQTLSTVLNGTDALTIVKNEKIDITGNKTWEDGNNQDGKRPNSIIVNLLADGVKVDSKEVTQENNWSYQFNDLPKYNEDKEINYTVTENDVPEYSATIDDFNIVNTYKPEMTLIKGKKVWKDGNNQDGKRPNSIIVNLLADGVQIDAKEVTAQDDWAYSFDNLPKYNTGKIIDYTVSENTVPEYQSAIEGTTITNTYVPKVIDINVKKEWRDTNNQDGIRPESIDVQLYAHDKKIGRPVTLTEENGWTHTWENLPEKEDGKTIEYSVKEVSDVPGYESGLKQENKTDIVITNTHIPEVTKIAGKKMWNDHQDREGKRPEKITINLLADGFKVDSQEVTAQDNWTYSFNNLPKYKAGKLIQYTVTENTVPDYSTHIDGTTITNEYTPGKTSITVTKAWDDNNNQDGIRPDSISVQFYANGKKVGKVVELNEKNNWTVTKEDLKEKEAGKMIEYTVKEVGKVEGYEVSINNDNKGNIILTNTHTPEQTPKKDDNNSTPSLNTKESSTNSPVSGSKTVEGTKNLPSTGEKNNNWLIIIGSILILLVAVYLWIKRKK